MPLRDDKQPNHADGRADPVATDFAATRPDHVPAELVRDFDHVMGADFARDPFAAFQEARRDRAFWSPHHGGYWVLTRMADIREALQHAELFSNWPTGIPVHPSRRERMVPLELDPPDHTAYRRVLAPMFAPKAVTARTAAIDRTCEQLVDGLAGKGRCDFIAEFAQPFPTTVFTNMLGLPAAESERFVGWNNVLLHSHGDPAARRRAGDDINAYLRELIAQRRAEPRDDLVSALLASPVDGRPIREDEVQNLTFMLFVAGLDTVTAALSFIFRFLAEHPDHRAQLVADPGLIPSAVEELLRVHAFINPARTVTRDLEFAGVTMRAGERLLVSTNLASTDPDEFPDPLVVRFDRPGNRHVAFGAGPHRCAGSHLARDELATAVATWHRHIPSYAVADGHPITVHAGGAMGIDALELVW
ncbi:cytochrome P450 [Pseudonocardia sp. GCM10023141]|uniref:cytochrome P450 n=1 Tax=Pseudonocardia sp. GCM10023141 TaxID=3252653 RepID=UPI0036208660